MPGRKSAQIPVHTRESKVAVTHGSCMRSVESVGIKNMTGGWTSGAVGGTDLSALLNGISLGRESNTTNR